ncbi:MAG: dihydroxy-acid dehydratase [Firmicutes bacterium]|nr:dihydroxy-acid dehydratase [Bacillota bacterium]
MKTTLHHAPQRTYFTAKRISLDKPLIAILNPISELDLSFIYFNKILEGLKAGIIEGGGEPIVVNMPSIYPHAQFGHAGGKFSLPMREVIADNVEAALSAFAYDGAVLITNSDIVSAGFMLGALRINTPAIFFNVGALYGEKKESLYDIYKGVGKVSAGSLSLDNLKKLEELTPSDIIDSNHAMALVIEALGLCVTNSSSSSFEGIEKVSLARETGRAIVRMIKDDITPRMILKRESILNAITFAVSAGLPLDTYIHLLAFANAIEAAKLDLNTIQTISDKTPVLVKEGTRVDEFHALGSVMAVLLSLKERGLLDTNALTYQNTPLIESLEKAFDNGFNKIDESLSNAGSVVIMRGNLAEDGAFIKRQQTSQTFSGKAKVYDSEEDALAAINAGQIKKGTVVVVRYEGPAGGPGMRELVALPALIEGMGLADGVALITDGRVNGASNGMFISSVMPEAYRDGKIALVKDGDKIDIDLIKQKVQLDIPSKELSQRGKKHKPKDILTTGMLLRYSKLVTSAQDGCTYRKKF